MPMCQSASDIYFLVVYFTTLSVIQTLIDELHSIWKEKFVA
jgi:hypothetical protein